jgi:hypothetical protein
VAAGTRIDLLLTDVIMPEMGGQALATALAQRVPQLRVLFMSGYLEQEIVRHGVLEIGGHLLRKPFTPEELVRRVREVLQR